MAEEKADLFDITALQSMGLVEEDQTEDPPTPPVDETEEEEVEEGKENEDGDQGDPISDETEEGKKEGEETDSPYLNFARLLKENGVLPDANLEKIEGATDLIDLVSAQIEAENGRYKESLPEAHQEILGMLESGFTQQEVIDFKKNEHLLDQVDETALSADATLQRNIYESWLKSQNYSDKHIEKLLAISEEELAQEAVQALGSLKEANVAQKDARAAQLEAEETARVAEQEQIVEDLKTQISSTKEIIPGRKITKAQKDKMLQLIMNNELQKTRDKDPFGFAIKSAYLLLEGIYDDKWDSVIKTAKTKVTQDFEKSIFNSSNRTGGVGSQTQETSSTEQTKALVDSLRHKF